MSLFDFVSKALGIPTDKQPILSSQEVAHVASGGGRTLSAGDPYSGYVYTCVNAISEKIAEINLQLVKTVGGKKEVVHDHLALELLDKVNPYTTSYLLWQRVGALMELEGKDYWLIWRDKAGRPAEIQMLDPCRTTPVIDTYGALLGYRYKMNGGKSLQLPPEMVLPFLNLDPYNPWNGKSTLSAAMLAAEANNLAAQFTTTQLKNGGRPDVILKFNNTLTAEQKDQLKSEWRNQYGRPQNAGKMMIAPAGLSVEQLTQSQIDMQMVEQRQYSRDEIMAIFRVPKSILGITDDVNRANAEAANYSFMEFNIIPKMRRIVSFMNEFYLPMFADAEGMKFELLNKPPKDELATLDRYQSGINNGWLSVNDIRRAEGMPLIAGGEMTYIGFGLTPLGEPEPSKSFEKPVAKSQTIIGIADELTQKLAKSFNKKNTDQDEPVEESPQAARLAILGEQFEEKGKAKEKKRDELLAPFEKQYNEAAKQLFEDQMKRAVSNLKKQKGKYLKKEKVNLLDPNAEIKITMELFKPIMAGLTKTAGQQALDELNLDQDFDSNLASDFIKKNSLRLATSMTKKTTEDLSSLIALGNENGESIDELTARIVEYSGFDDARAETIARTETIRGSSSADMEAWKQTDVVSKAIWYTALDERVDEDCMFLHGTEVDLGDEFMDEDTLIGFGIQPYGGGVEFPPLHPNCRCTIIPVVED